MQQQVALLIYVIFMLWLFVRDRKLRPMTSWALWVPLLWILIIGSRPVSIWLSGQIRTENPTDILDGSPLDRNVFLLLILGGFVVLWLRRVNWGQIFTSNRWLFAFFIYFGISVIWSDYPFVSFKRWIKDLGNLVMILVILTEKDPIQAIKAVFARYTNFAIPLSVIFIKYFPELGRYYYQWIWLPAYCGVALGKNDLGAIIYICGLFLVWDLIKMRNSGGRKTDKADLLSRVVLLLMVFWLLYMADSKTALVCLILGIGIILLIQVLPKGQFRYLGLYGLVLGLLILILYSVSGFDTLTGMVGRESTLTGRTDLWRELIKAPINPLFGEGYQSFWSGPISEYYAQIFWWKPNQAHNGYLEIYLNGGLVGVFLLMAMIVSGGSKLKKELLLGSSYGGLLLSFFVVVLFNNWTEAAFYGLGFTWFMLLTALLNYPHSPSSIPENMADSVKSGLL